MISPVRSISPVHRARYQDPWRTHWLRCHLIMGDSGKIKLNIHLHNIRKCVFNVNATSNITYSFTSLSSILYTMELNLGCSSLMSNTNRLTDKWDWNRQFKIQYIQLIHLNMFSSNYMYTYRGKTSVIAYSCKIQCIARLKL